MKTILRVFVLLAGALVQPVGTAAAGETAPIVRPSILPKPPIKHPEPQPPAPKALPSGG